MYPTLGSLGVSVIFFSRGLNLLTLLLRFEGFLLGYDSISRVYRVFNKRSGCVEITCDVIFHGTDGSQVEQYDLDDVDNEEASCDALRTMTIGDVRLQEVNEDQPSSNEVAPPTQANDQDQENGQNKYDDQDQDVSNDQGGVEQDKDKNDQEESRSLPPPNPRVRQIVQYDHPVNNILGDIKKGVTT
jgi:hypothetical protein